MGRGSETQLKAGKILYCKIRARVVNTCFDGLFRHQLKLNQLSSCSRISVWTRTIVHVTNVTMTKINNEHDEGTCHMYRNHSQIAVYFHIFSYLYMFNHCQHDFLNKLIITIIIKTVSHPILVRTKIFIIELLPQNFRLEMISIRELCVWFRIIWTCISLLWIYQW